MYDRILIHVDRRKSFESAVPYLQGVLRRHIAREAVLSTVVPPAEPTLFGFVFDPADVARVDAHDVQEADELLRRLAAQLTDEGVVLRTEVLRGDPAEAFREYAAGEAFDLVVIAPTGRRYLLTGKPRKFRRALHEVHKPVMILPPGPLTPHAL